MKTQWSDLDLRYGLIAFGLVVAFAATAHCQPWPDDPGDKPWTSDPNYKAPPPPGVGSKSPPQASGLPAIYHPYPQPYPTGTTITTRDKKSGGGFAVSTGKSVFPTPYVDPFTRPPGTNLLPNVFTNAFDLQGVEMLNTLPSTTFNPYNLHDGDPVVTEINKTSPTDDLKIVFNEIDRVTGKLQELKTNLAVAQKASTVNKRLVYANEEELDLLQDELAGLIQLGQKILLGEPLNVEVQGSVRLFDRAYEGFPVLHYDAASQVKPLDPIFDPTGKVIGANVDIHQIWYDIHIESDTAFIDLKPSGLPEDVVTAMQDVPWTVTYTVDVLSRGHDDFSPFNIYLQTVYDESKPVPPKLPASKLPKPLVGLDGSFFPMEDGTRTVVKIKMAQPRYLNLIYTWGWRMHPPRIQSTERLPKKAGFLTPDGKKPDPKDPNAVKSLLAWEQDVFCRTPDDPNCSPRDDVDFAVSKISDLAPAKRMLQQLIRASRAAENAKATVSAKAAVTTYDEVLEANKSARAAWIDWQDRSSLPDGITVMENGDSVPIQDSELWDEVDMVVCYLNNTIYGEFTEGGIVRWDEWTLRHGATNHVPLPPYNLNRLPKELQGNKNRTIGPKAEKSVLRLALLNGDYFDHGYQNVDFGGARGWENQYKSSVKFGGSGCWFTFGRVHWFPNLPGAIRVPMATKSGDNTLPGSERLDITFNYEPSTRLRFYQYDPMHHNVAIYSVH